MRDKDTEGQEYSVGRDGGTVFVSPELSDSESALYLTPAQARTLADWLLQMADEATVEVTASFPTDVDLAKRVAEAAGREPGTAGLLGDGSVYSISWFVPGAEAEELAARLRAVEGVTVEADEG